MPLEQTFCSVAVLDASAYPLAGDAIASFSFIGGCANGFRLGILVPGFDVGGVEVGVAGVNLGILGFDVNI